MSSLIRNFPIIYLILLLALITRFSETIYLPSLSFIAKEFNISIFLAETTSAVFFLGISIGSSIWGIISDFISKKKTIILGMIFYIIGCFGCFFASYINMLIFFKFIQGIGASSGIIIAQILTREEKDSTKRAKIFSILFSIIALVPALGPILGTYITTNINWQFNFIIMIILGIIIIFLTAIKETKNNILNNNKLLDTFLLIKKMIFDKKIICFAVLIGACNGVMFSYYTEGAFYMINLLNFNSYYYSYSYILLAIAAFMGGKFSHKFASLYSSMKLIKIGIRIVIISTLSFLIFAILNQYQVISNNLLIFGSIFCMSIFVFGNGLIVPNCMSIALNNYNHMIGAATSFLGAAYYAVMSFISFFMAILRNDNIMLMPLYFFCVSLIIYITYKKLN